MSAGSPGWAEVIRKIQLASVEEGGVLLPAPSAEIAPPQDAKLNALAPEPSDQRELWHLLQDPTLPVLFSQIFGYSKKGKRIDPRPIHSDRPMEVRSCGPSRGAHPAKHGSFANSIPLPRQGFGEMEIHGV